MPRRPLLRPAEIASAAEALKKGGLNPTALEVKPDGTYRWCFTNPLCDDEDDVDRELAEFDKKHGYG